jgi:hypothetical protein
MASGIIWSGFLTIWGVRIAGFVRRRTSCGAIFEGWDGRMGWRRVLETWAETVEMGGDRGG